MNGERTLTVSTPDLAIASRASRSIKVPLLNFFLFPYSIIFLFFFKSSLKTLPKIIEWRYLLVFPSSSFTFLTVPLQSIFSSPFPLITMPAATSTNLLVKYPESAVLRAVSARPFLAP